MSVGRSSGEAEASPDPSWRGLYRVGGISAVLYVVLSIITLVLLIITPPAPSSDGAAILQYIASNKSVYILELVLFVGICVPAIVVFMALYVALKHLNKSYAAIAAVVAIASQVVGLAFNGSPPSLNGGLVYLSGEYVAATTAAQHTAFATAAEGLIAVTNAVNSAGILFEVGILIISLVMLKGVFHKGVAYLGIVTGAIGIVSEAFRPILGFGYVVFFVLEVIWLIAVGWKLYRLG
jgi:uncharacterized protein DUF4386